MSRRTERIAEELKSEIARVLREEVSDPRIQMVTLTRVDVAPDLTSAFVFWSTLEPESVDRIQDGLTSAAPFVRWRLARDLPLKRMPELRFRHDPSLDMGDRTLALLRNLDDGDAS